MRKSFFQQKNKGRFVLESTLVMPVVLVIVVLCLSLMLSMYEQVRVHCDLVTSVIQNDETKSEYDKQTSKYKVVTDRRNSEETQYKKDGNIKIFTQEQELELVNSYAVYLPIEHRQYSEKIVSKMRGWQLGETILSAGGLSSVCGLPR